MQTPTSNNQISTDLIQQGFDVRCESYAHVSGNYRSEKTKGITTDDTSYDFDTRETACYEDDASGDAFEHNMETIEF